MNYSEKIKTARENLLMTQEEFASELGVTPITVCRWETGKTEPSFKTKKTFRDLCARNGIAFNENHG